MSNLTLYHNPRCSKSRETLALLRENGREPEIVEYLKTPLDAAGLVALAEALGLPPRAMMRKGEAVYRELGLADETLPDTALFAAMAANPILIERPVLVSDTGAAICRPPERALDLI